MSKFSVVTDVFQLREPHGYGSGYDPETTDTEVTGSITAQRWDPL